MLGARGSRFVFLLPIALAALACGSSDDSSGGVGACETGEVIECTCPDGSTGSQTCDDNGGLSACACGGIPPGDMTGGGTGAVGNAGGGGMDVGGGMGGLPGMGGMAGIPMGGMAGMGGDVSMGGAPPVGTDLGVGDGSDVVLIGDSWMNLGGVGLQQSLIAVSGQPYRAYGVPGTRLLDGAIGSQYDQAKAENPDIKTLVVVGGGNDIIQDIAVLTDCLSVGPACQARVAEIQAYYEGMSAQAMADGIQDVVIIVYTRGTAVGAGLVDYVWTTLGPTCDNAPVDCHMVDADEAVPGIMTTRDGIHPTDEGYDALGVYVHQTMVNEGMRR